MYNNSLQIGMFLLLHPSLFIFISCIPKTTTGIIRGAREKKHASQTTKASPWTCHRCYDRFGKMMHTTTLLKLPRTSLVRNITPCGQHNVAHQNEEQMVALKHCKEDDIEVTHGSNRPDHHHDTIYRKPQQVLHAIASKWEPTIGVII